MSWHDSQVRSIVAFFMAATLCAARPAAADTRSGDDCSALPRSQMRVRLSFATGDTESSSTIRDTVSRFWAREGVLLRWLPASAGPMAWDDVDLWIVVQQRPASARDETSLGSIVFADGQPQRLVRLSVGAVERWVRWQLGLRNGNVPRRVSLALGYAAAHEVGHFVLGSPDHAPEGLMKVAYDRPGMLDTAEFLQLDAANRTRLAQRLARGDSCP